MQLLTQLPVTVQLSKEEEYELEKSIKADAEIQTATATRLANIPMTTHAMIRFLFSQRCSNSKTSKLA